MKKIALCALLALAGCQAKLDVGKPSAEGAQIVRLEVDRKFAETNPDPLAFKLPACSAMRDNGAELMVYVFHVQKDAAGQGSPEHTFVLAWHRSEC